MKNKIYITLIFLLILNVHNLCQVQTEIQSSRVFDLAVVQVFPDSFPTVDVIFQARDDSGRPLWGISKEDLIVYENEIRCEVLELVNLSESEILDIAIVFDHSGSMGYPSIPDSLHNYDWTQEQIDSLMLLPKAIEFAKEGVLSFLSSGAIKQDSILIVGFSSETDSIVGPTQIESELVSKVNSMNADYGTAFYDALVETMKHLSKKDGQKSAVVALTDGQDNESTRKIDELIEISKSLDIPVYIIGLGSVQDSTLKSIANSTDGLYYKTDDPKRLQEIYLNISRQLKSVYRLKYASKIVGFADDENSLSFGFNNDTVTFSNPDMRLTLPKEVVTYLHQEEKNRIEEIQNRNLLLGGTASGIVALGIATFLLYRRKKKKKFQISKVYPNPFSDMLRFQIENGDYLKVLRVEILDLNGIKVHNQELDSGRTEFELDLSHLPKGSYILIAQTSDGRRDSAKAMKK